MSRKALHSTRHQMASHRDVLHDRDGALAHERDGHRVGANAVARDAAGGVGGIEQGGLLGGPSLRCQ
jgi:hypothetical protein